MLKRVIEKIQSNKSFLITTHMNLEGDALGAALATYILLRKLKKRVRIYNNDPTPQIYRFLPYQGVIKNSLPQVRRTLNTDRFDVAIALDCSDSSRLGKVQDYLSRAACIINIDHHISNTFFGDINWVNSKASSVCEMLYELVKKLKISDRKIAICLYTGIFTDTGNFTYTNTTKSTHRIIADLMDSHIKPHEIYENLHSLCAPLDLKFIGKIISSLKFDSRKRICWANIEKWEEKNYDLTEVIFSIMRLLRGVEVFILFKKVEKNKTMVSFRSRSRVDVNRIAQFFGGGGHKRASGTTVRDSLERVEKKVIRFTQNHLR